MSKNFKVKNGLETTNITASANVSSSGAIIGNEITASGLNLVGSGTAELEVQGNITASGNISGSLTSTGSFGHIKIDGTNIKTFISSSAAADGFGGGAWPHGEHPAAGRGDGRPEEADGRAGRGGV